MIRRVATVPIDASHRARVLAAGPDTLVIHEHYRQRLDAFVLVGLELVDRFAPVPTGALGAAILDARQIGAAECAGARP